jgi:hypothetical protein
MFNKILPATLAVAAVSLPAFASPFSDVSPNNWAYQAIMNLRSKYGCAAGYPDGTFRSGKPATRAELAALTNACLDEISSYSDAKDAALASALRAEIGAVGGRVAQLELKSAQKAQGVGNYVGAGFFLNSQGVKGSGNDADDTISGATVQGRYVAKTFDNQNSVSIRPYVNFAGDPSGQIGAGGGVMASYDFSLLKASTGVSRANLYTGIGYQLPFTTRTEANFQSAIGKDSGGELVFALGFEGRLTNSLVGFADLKFPVENSGKGDYSPVFTTGLGLKF